MSEERPCKVCGRTLTLEQFGIRGDGYRRRTCRACWSIHCLARNKRRRKQDPKGYQTRRKRELADKKKRYAERKQDPAYRERIRTYNRERIAKMTPVQLERHKELQKKRSAKSYQKHREERIARSKLLNQQGYAADPDYWKKKKVKKVLRKHKILL